jgi:hypothetical protein
VKAPFNDPSWAGDDVESLSKLAHRRHGFLISRERATADSIRIENGQSGDGIRISSCGSFRSDSSEERAPGAPGFRRARAPLVRPPMREDHGREDPA